jgi:ribonuclease HII
MSRPGKAPVAPWPRPQRAVIRGSTGIWAWESALHRYGLGPVAGVDEAGRGACAGPLVIAACVPRPGDAARWEGLTDSKLLTASAREHFYELIVRRAVDWSVVIVPPPEVDSRGVHAANVAGMRRAVARLGRPPGYVLTDGFRVPGLGVPNLAVPKGDQAAACVAAASVLAKVTRDRIMVALHEEWPCYGFAEHKGYCTPAHERMLREYGPSPVHRFSFVNVSRSVSRSATRAGAVRVVAGVGDNARVVGGSGIGAQAGDADGVQAAAGQGVES